MENSLKQEQKKSKWWQIRSICLEFKITFNNVFREDKTMIPNPLSISRMVFDCYRNKTFNNIWIMTKLHRNSFYFSLMYDFQAKKVVLQQYLWIQSRAHLAFWATQGMFSIALNNLCFSFESLMYVSRSKLYISDKKWHKVPPIMIISNKMSNITTHEA